MEGQVNQKNINDIIIDQEENFKNTSKNNKANKILRILVPIIAVELILSIAMGLFLFFTSKNSCEIITNNKDAIIYVNNKQTTKFILNDLDQGSDGSYFDVCIEVLMPEGCDYKVEFYVECEHEVKIETQAVINDNVYIQHVDGGIKTELISRIGIMDNIDKINLKIIINIEQC